LQGNVAEDERVKREKKVESGAIQDVSGWLRRLVANEENHSKLVA
jgi:hypothetical protein